MMRSLLYAAALSALLPASAFPSKGMAEARIEGIPRLTPDQRAPWRQTVQALFQGTRYANLPERYYDLPIAAIQNMNFSPRYYTGVAKDMPGGLPKEYSPDLIGILVKEGSPVSFNEVEILPRIRFQLSQAVDMLERKAKSSVLRGVSLDGVVREMEDLQPWLDRWGSPRASSFEASVRRWSAIRTMLKLKKEFSAAQSSLVEGEAVNMEPYSIGTRRANTMALGLRKIPSASTLKRDDLPKVVETVNSAASLALWFQTDEMSQYVLLQALIDCAHLDSVLPHFVAAKIAIVGDQSRFGRVRKAVFDALYRLYPEIRPD